MAPPKSRSKRSKPFLISSTSSRVTQGETQSLGLKLIVRYFIARLLNKTQFITRYNVSNTGKEQVCSSIELKRKGLKYSLDVFMRSKVILVFYLYTQLSYLPLTPYNDRQTLLFSPICTAFPNFFALQINSLPYHCCPYFTFISINHMKHQNVLSTRMKSYSFLKVLGQGAWAIVYQAFDQKTNTNIAIKAIPKILMQQTPKLKELVNTQIKVLKECKNQNVIKFVDSFSSEKTQFIAMQFCDGGDLQQYLKLKKRLTEDEATTFLKQILNGFKGLHEVHAMHRDFKVANVLLHQGNCKIADLGFAKQMEKKKTTGTILGTSLTMAPELLREHKYGMEADIWSIGVVYYQLLYNKYPFMGKSDIDILKQIETTKPDFSGVNLSANAIDFIERCLTDSPTKRISWREIYDHPLIKSQQKMVYVLASRINMKNNEDFYKKDIKINEEFILLDKDLQKEPKVQPEAMKKKESKEQVIVQATQKVDMDKLIKENEEKKKISQAIQKFEKTYLNKRNNIMFIFKFVTPYIYNLYDINASANHAITLFIICKKAYHQMKHFVQYLKNQIDFLKLGPFFPDFVNNPKYKAIMEVVGQDLDVVKYQLQAFGDGIQYCNDQIKKEFDIEAVFNQNWSKLVRETIDQYVFQLAQGFKAAKEENKKVTIKVVQALIYYKDNVDADVESFDKRIETLDYNHAEANLKQKLDQVYK